MKSSRLSGVLLKDIPSLRPQTRLQVQRERARRGEGQPGFLNRAEGESISSRCGNVHPQWGPGRRKVEGQSDFPRGVLALFVEDIPSRGGNRRTVTHEAGRSNELWARVAHR